MDGEAITRHNVLERMLLDDSAEPTSLTLSLLQAITKDFSDELQIGRGGFATVYKGMLGNGTVAVKKLKETLDIDEKKFNREVECLMGVKHKNIVRFLGYCSDTQGIHEKYKEKFVMADVRHRLLCFEYLPKGSLDKYITDASRGLGWKVRYPIIKGICEGLYYLHQKSIIHLDLKPANILLDDSMVPKIADFGLSRCFDRNQSGTLASKLIGTPGYMAPEFFLSGRITFRLDIFSLGVIIMEMLTGNKEHSAVEKVVESWKNRLEISEGDTLLEQVRVCAEIGIECMNFDPAKRPVTRHIIERLDKTGNTDCSVETGFIKREMRSSALQLGMASALETLCGQSYGAKLYHMLGIYLQRSRIIFCACVLQLLPVYLPTATLQDFCVQHPEIADFADTILQLSISGLFSYACTLKLQMYLQAQSKNIIIGYLGHLNLCLNLVLSWLMTVKCHLGLAGVMGSMVMAVWIPDFGQIAFVFFGGCPLTWTGFSSAPFTHLAAIVKLSLSSGDMPCLELWYNTILVLLTGYMKNAEVALDALLISLGNIYWEEMIFFGLLATTRVLVANKSGAGSARRAKFAFFNAVITSFMIVFPLLVYLLVLRASAAYICTDIFTESQAMPTLVADLSPFLAFSILLNSVQPVLSGVAVGARRQTGVPFSILSYYLIIIPLGAILLELITAAVSELNSVYKPSRMMSKQPL